MTLDDQVKPSYQVEMSEDGLLRIVGQLLVVSYVFVFGYTLARMIIQ